MFKKIAIATATAALFGIGQAAWAGATASQTLTVNASVATNCRVTTGPGTVTPSYDPTTPGGSPAVNFTPTIVFRCTKGTSSVSVSATLGAHAASTQRQLSLSGGAGGPFLTYQLYQPGAGTPTACAYTTIYNSGVSDYTVGAVFTTSTTDVTVNLCGQIDAGQDAATGTYSDLVSVVVNY